MLPPGIALVAESGLKRKRNTKRTRAGNRVSVCGVGRFLIGRASGKARRSAEDRPESRFASFPNKNPAKMRPGNSYFRPGGAVT